MNAPKYCQQLIEKHVNSQSVLSRETRDPILAKLPITTEFAGAFPLTRF